MKRYYTKTLILSLLMLVSSMTASAFSGKFAVKPFTINPGETVTVPVEMINSGTANDGYFDSDILTFNLTLSLPAGSGLKFVTQKSGKTYIWSKLNPDRIEDHTIAAGPDKASATAEMETMNLVAGSATGATFYEIEGDIFEVYIKAADDIKGGTYDLTVSNQVITPTDFKGIKPASFTAKITVPGGAVALPVIKTFAATNGTTNVTTTGEDNKFVVEGSTAKFTTTAGSIIYTIAAKGGVMTATEVGAGDQSVEIPTGGQVGACAASYWVKHTASPAGGYATVAYDLKGTSIICSNGMTPQSTTVKANAKGVKYVEASDVANARIKNASGVLVKCAAGSYYLAASADASNVTTCLTAALTETTLGSNLVFGTFTSGANKGKAGFGKDPDGKVSAHHAYMANPNPTSAQEVIFIEDASEATGISGVSANSNVKVYYNIAGQRVANPTSGLYIVNGKKVLVK